MLQLLSLSLTHFKNYQRQTFSFSKKIIGICGNNGIGKTNLLDAICYLCFTKSYFTHADGQCVTQGQQGFRIDGRADITKNDITENLNITCVLRETGKKEFSVNGELYARLSKHVGRLPCVIIAPDDISLIVGGSEERRRFIDTLLCQLNSDYLQQLMDYNKLLQQRNSLLKSFAEQGKKDENLLQVISDQLSQKGQYIYSIRNVFLQEILPQVITNYRIIAQPEEPINLYYRSQLHNESMRQLLMFSLSKDIVAQRTTNGIHRDDLELLLKEQPFKQLASQGQRKSLLFALKLTEFEILQQEKGFAPILLLDDVFEKLDAGRMENLLKEVCIRKNGQVFITDTHKERLEKNLRVIGADYEIIEL